MPLIKRSIEPVYLSRRKLEKGLKNELEAVSVNTLSGVIRQLSCLSKHAEDIFGELFNEANSIFKRTRQLQERVESLQTKVTKLDSSVEEISLQDINMRKAFRSTIVVDQQVVSPGTITKAMSEKYKTSDHPPNLRAMNPYRDDGRDAMKFYTDPRYFFDLWYEEEMKKQSEKKKNKKKRSGPRQRTPSRQKKAVKAVKKKVYCAEGEEFRPHGTIKKSSVVISESGSNQSSSSPTSPEDYSPKANGTIPSRDPPTHNYSAQHHQVQSGGRHLSPLAKRTSRRYTGSNVSRPTSAPPPPPAPPSNSSSPASPPTPCTPEVPPPLSYNNQYPSPTSSVESLPHPSASSPYALSSIHSPIPVPPPPPPSLSLPNDTLHIPIVPPPPPSIRQVIPQVPPPPPPVASPPSHSPSSSSISTTASTSESNISAISNDNAKETAAAAKHDKRSDLLAAIRQGMTLRKVEVEESKKNSVVTMDVASILARRMVVEFSSDSESNTGSEWEDSDEE